MGSLGMRRGLLASAELHVSAVLGFMSSSFVSVSGLGAVSRCVQSGRMVKVLAAWYLVGAGMMYWFYSVKAPNSMLHARTCLGPGSQQGIERSASFITEQGG